MVVNLPHQFDASTMHSFINQVIDENLHPKSDAFTFNLSTMGFIRPSGVTILSNIIEWLKSKGVNVEFQLPQYYGHQQSPVKFLDDSLFFERYIGRKLFQTAAPRSTTIPLKLVSYDESFQWLENHLIVWLERRLNLTAASLVNIKICFVEIFNNIKDHSYNNIGCVFAQHLPRENIIQFAISDFGVGIPYNVKRLLPTLSDSESILKATEEGFSTKSTRRNAGAGLDILINNVVLNNKGSLSIYSNYGGLFCNVENDSISKNTITVNGYYPGTLIYVHLRTDTIDAVEDNWEEFEW